MRKLHYFTSSPSAKLNQNISQKWWRRQDVSNGDDDMFRTISSRSFLKTVFYRFGYDELNAKNRVVLSLTQIVQFEFRHLTKMVEAPGNDSNKNGYLSNGLS
jgi:hypothetical protein